MELLMEIFRYSIWGNTVQQYLIALVVFLMAVLALKLVQKIVIRQISGLVERTKTHIDDALLNVVRTIKPPFYWFLAFYIGIQYVALAGPIAKAVDVLLISWITYQAILALQIFLKHLINTKLVDKNDRASEVVSSILGAITTIVLWAIGILFVLSNVGVNVASLLTGLGIGGLAIALAAQRLLEDLFSSLAIYFDKPFAPGDFIVVGDVSGTVQRVGIKTTRIKSLLGEEIIVPNKDLTGARIRNFKRMEGRRVEFTIGVTYGTSQEKMKKIPEIIQGIIDPIEQAVFSRAHFTEFNDFSLDFSIVYKVEAREFDVYMDIHQKVLLGIKEAFEREGVEIAFPTQQLLVSQTKEG